MGLCWSWGLLPFSKLVFSSAVLEHLAFCGGEGDKGISKGFSLLQIFKENQQVLSQVHLGENVIYAFQIHKVFSVPHNHSE